MIGLLEWFVRRVGARTLLILGLLAVALSGMDWTLSAIVRGLDLDLLLTITLVGAVSGWLLARSRVPPLVAGLLIVLIALVTGFLRVGQLGDRLFAVFTAIVNALWDTQFGKFQWQPILETTESLIAGIVTLLTRLEGWSRALGAGQSTYEPVASALVWSFIVCLLTGWAAWHLRRADRAFVSLLPLALFLALVIAYSGRDLWVIPVVLAVWLGLLGAVPFITRQRRWEQEGVPFAEDLVFDHVVIVGPVILLLVTAAVTFSALTPSAIAHWFQQWSESTPAPSPDVISNSFGIEAAPRPSTALDRVSSPGLPRSHLLGASPELLKKVALTVQTDDTAKGLPALYWLGTTYDEYTGHGWFSSGFREQTYRAGERLSHDALPSDRLFHQTVRVANDTGIVYAAGILESVDHDYQVAWRQPGDMLGAQVNSSLYRAESFVPSFSADTLRAAGEAYPNWIRTQYLRVPENLPPRVLALARDLTAPEPTPYDRARAIERYLRTIPYSLDVPLPPGGRDVVDYFLFDLRRGYCDYYATAMAMLARAAGLPARVAVGYASGQFNPVTHTYTVTEADAHSWTQIYFPNYGWVNFEPTNGRAPIEHDTPGTAGHITPALYTDNTNSFGNIEQQVVENFWFVLPGAILGFGVLAFASLFIDTLYLRRLTQAKLIDILYQRILHVAVLLGLSITPSQTPYQMRARLDEYFAMLAGSRTARLWQAVSPVTDLIISQYEKTTYGAYALNKNEAAIVLQKWQSVRLRLVLLVFLNFLQEQLERSRIPSRGMLDSGTQ
ncbi:MAG TPA: transglutaminase-like domain-containing protein [Anaerolineae bacterium]|nr:transglutaminase-like domain-containing protein [Anaerolineae bacterium]